jgi:hypothetical protein
MTFDAVEEPCDPHAALDGIGASDRWIVLVRAFSASPTMRMSFRGLVSAPTPAL